MVGSGTVMVSESLRSLTTEGSVKVSSTSEKCNGADNCMLYILV